jgi:hypothetical protein
MFCRPQKTVYGAAVPRSRKFRQSVFGRRAFHHGSMIDHANPEPPFVTVGVEPILPRVASHARAQIGPGLVTFSSLEKSWRMGSGFSFRHDRGGTGSGLDQQQNSSPSPWRYYKPSG